MTTPAKLLHLLQLASPTLPVGAYSYSQGLEAAVEAGVVHDAPSAQAWIGDVLEFSVARMEAPLFLRMCRSPGRWNDLFLATRESAELRAETVQMGYSLRRLAGELRIGEMEGEEVVFPAAFAFVVARWEIDPGEALVAYLWSWLENQVMAAIKAVPLGQTDGQRILLQLAGRIPQVVERAQITADADLGSFAPGLAVLSSRHETQYSRLFRS